MPGGLDFNNRKRKVPLARREKNKRKKKKLSLQSSAIRESMSFSAEMSTPTQTTPIQPTAVLTPNNSPSLSSYGDEAIIKAISDTLAATCGCNNERKRTILESVLLKHKSTPAPIVDTSSDEVTTTMIPWNPKAFHEGRSNTAASSKKCRTVQKFTKAIEAAIAAAGDTLEQKYLILHEYLEKTKGGSLIKSMLQSFAVPGDLPKETLNNVKVVVDLAKEKAKSYDAKTFRATMLMAMVSKEAMTKSDVTKLAKYFGVPMKAFKPKFKAAMISRRQLLLEPSKNSLVVSTTRKSSSIITPILQTSRAKDFLCTAANCLHPSMRSES